MRSVTPPLRAAATVVQIIMGRDGVRPSKEMNRKDKNGALGFLLPFCDIIKRVPKKDVSLP